MVGGGLTGSSAALALAKKGARVILLEAETIGNAASGRNGGMCNNGFAQDYAACVGQARHARRPTGSTAPSTLAWTRSSGSSPEEGIDCNFARVGKLKLAAKPEHYDKLARAQELLARHVDPDTEMVRRADSPRKSGRSATTAG